MKQLSLGIAGLGHVGCGVLDLIERQARLRLPGAMEVAGVCARSRTRNRSVSIDQLPWFDDPVDLASAPSVDVFVELIGGSDGPAKKAVETALGAGKSVVTANKALIAEHGQALAAIAEETGANLLFEAAVAGGVPVVRVLRDSLAGIEVERVAGILNGTCNFLLTEMLASGREYGDVLAEAQKLGYAEADPTLDVSGMDAAHKAAILSSIAFSADLDFSKVRVTGVDRLELLDLRLADRLGYRIKLIAEGLLRDDSVICRVAPMALRTGHPLAAVNGSLNSVRVEGDPVGAVTMTGPGAGAGPTASAVVGDLALLFRNGASSPFGAAGHHVQRSFAVPTGDERVPWFIRLKLADKPGALAHLSEALAEQSVSVDKLIQDSADESGAAPIAIVTHACTRREIEAALARAAEDETSVDDARLIRIEAE